MVEGRVPVDPPFSRTDGSAAPAGGGGRCSERPPGRASARNRV